MIKKLITFIIYLFFLTCGDNTDTIVGDDGGGSGLTVDCMNYPVPVDCPTNETVDGVPGCAYLEDYCTPSICVGGTSLFSENQAYCDCNGDYIPGIEPLNLEGDCSNISTTGCSQEDGCGICYGGNTDVQQYTNCDCNGDVVPEDCENSAFNTSGCAINEVCGCIGGNTGLDSCPSECPDNFTISPQSTIQETICVPNDFFYYVSTMQAGYIINSINSASIILETSNCTGPNDCDWVAAFNPNNDVCVGATMWDLSACNSNICSINVGGVSGESTSDYMPIGVSPIFKIYDTSENAYYDAIPSEDIPWSPGDMNMINELNLVLP